jgi:hypothetical protein
MFDHGVDQVAIACAFLTGGGAELLKRHTPRLKLPDSFLVAAWEAPTNLEAVEELHSLFPGNVYIHLGAQTPIERGVGPGLMHSKVFLAREGNRGWLWTGSHNLTASAAQGVNCEAAVVLEGTMDEQPFQEALAHLNQCKQEAVVFDPHHPPPAMPPQQTLIIHAECHVALKALPWFVHLRPATTDYDRAMRPPGSVWLYLYNPNALRSGFNRPRAMAAYSGTITALNFTEHHANQGIPADWTGADFVIEQNNGVFRLTDPKPHTTTPTQGVFRIDVVEPPSTVWLKDSPTPKRERVVGKTRVQEVDPEFRQFFTSRSLQGRHLVHREYKDVRTIYRLPRKEIGDMESSALLRRLNVPDEARVEIEELRQTDDKFEFIYIAKYRI